MSFPIPSFFKIRCGIIIIAFMLFFMFIGMLKQALAWSCSESYYVHVPSKAYSCKETLLADFNALSGEIYWQPGTCYSDQPCALCYGIPPGELFWEKKVNGVTHCLYLSPGYVETCNNVCPDTNNNGKPDACESCPSQSGYKSNFLGVITYCGNTVTQCNGQSNTSYEWGFSSDNCTPTQEPDCHVTADCKKDLNQDGIADGSEGGGTYSGNPKADRDGDDIPDLKDCDFDFDGDSKKNCEDPCPLKSNPGTAICPDPCEGGTAQCQDADGDGIPDCTCPVAPPCWQCADGDGDGVPNGVDNDIDGDGIPNAQDSDMDGDGIPNTEDDDIDGDGIPNSEDEDDDGDGTPDDEEDGDGDGDGTPDGEETKPYAPTGDPYSIEEETSSQTGARFGDRFKKFFDDMKATSVFSIPGQIFGDLPTGGSPSFTIDGGQTFGTHELNMDSWVPGLAALRAVLYIIAGWGAVKIALLGK